MKHRNPDTSLQKANPLYSQHAVWACHSYHAGPVFLTTCPVLNSSPLAPPSLSYVHAAPFQSLKRRTKKNITISYPLTRSHAQVTATTMAASRFKMSIRSVASDMWKGTQERIEWTGSLHVQRFMNCLSPLLPLHTVCWAQLCPRLAQHRLGF